LSPQIYFSLSQTDSIRGDFFRAFQNYKMGIYHQDSIFSKERRKESERIQMQYDFDKKETLAKAEQEKKDVLMRAEIHRQKVVRNFSVAGAFVILLFGGIAFYNFRKRKRLENLQRWRMSGYVSAAICTMTWALRLAAFLFSARR
jgi:hypothetical protein